MSLDLRYGNLVLCLNSLGKHKLGPHPLKSQTLKPYACKALKANAKIMFFTANL